MSTQAVNGAKNMLKWTGERYLPYEDPEIIGVEIHYEHLHRYAFAVQFVSGKRVLDLASGEGYGSYMLSKEADNVVGIEIDQDTIVHAKNKYKNFNINFIQGSVLDVPIDGEKLFDIIVCFEALEHVKDHEKLLSEVKRLLKDDGLFIVSTPNKGTYTDETNYSNPYHIKELYLKEFTDLLHNYFSNTCFLGQKAYTGSNIWPLFGVGPSYSEFVVGKGDEGFYFKNQTEKAPVYIIAIASNSLNDINLIKSYLIDESNTSITHRDKQISAITVRADTLEQWVIERDKRLRELDTNLRSSSERAQELNRMVIERDKRLEELDTNLRSSGERAQELNQMVIELNRRILEQDLQLQERSDRNEELKHQITQMQHSVTWQLLMRYHNCFVEHVLPHGTKQRKIYEQGLKGGRVLVNEGWKSFYRNVKEYQKIDNPTKLFDSDSIDAATQEEISKFQEEERLICQYSVAMAFTPVTTQIDLKAGHNLIRFHVPEGCKQPSSIPELMTEDGRCLSLAFKDMAIQGETSELPLSLGNHWHGIEECNGDHIRWMANDATVLVSPEYNCQANLSLEALSFYHPRTLEIYVKTLRDNSQNKKDGITKYVLMKEVNSQANLDIVKNKIEAIIEKSREEIRK
jgi:ubiquinone/menaquinone biosynthesis C-methylase UbiE